VPPNTATHALMNDEPDPARRIALAVQLGVSERILARVVLDVLGDEPIQSRRFGLAAAVHVSFRECHGLTVDAWTQIVTLVLPLIEPRDIYFDWLAPGRKQDCWFAIRDWLATAKSKGSLGRLEQNFLSVGLGCWWPPGDWRGAVEQLREDLDTLGVHIDGEVRQSPD
jgi:hypothetical protein